MRIRRGRVPTRGELLSLAQRLSNIDQRQARTLARLCASGRAASRARARVLSPDTDGVVDLLAAVDCLAAGFPLPRDTPDGAAAFTAAADVLIATHGRHRLSPAQRLTLTWASVHTPDPLER